MSKVVWFTLFCVLFVSMPFSALAIDLSRLYGHLGPPPQKRSGGAGGKLSNNLSCFCVVKVFNGVYNLIYCKKSRTKKKVAYYVIGLKIYKTMKEKFMLKNCSNSRSNSIKVYANEFFSTKSLNCLMIHKTLLNNICVHNIYRWNTDTDCLIVISLIIRANMVVLVLLQ